MSIFRSTPPAKPPKIADLRAKRDRLRADLDAAKAEGERLDGTKASTNDELRSAVEDGDAASRGQLMAQLGKLNADLEANRTLVAVTEGALSAAEAVLVEAEDAERRERARALLAETEETLRAARASLAPAAVAFFEARGRVRELEQRIPRLRRAYLAMGGQGVSRPGDGGGGRTSVEIAIDAVRAKHGEQVCFDNVEDVRALGAHVRGLVGPEPEL